jgi:hypothetical protein
MISSEQVHDIAALVERQGLGTGTLEQLRQSYPGVHFTLCMDDDINQPSPVLTGKGFNLYLVGGGHCLALTTDYASATGLVLAELCAET